MIHQLTDKAIGVEVPADQKYFDLYGDKSGCDMVYNTMLAPGKFKKQSITLPEGNWTILGMADNLNMDQIYEIIKGTSLSFNKLLESKNPNLDKRTTLILIQRS